LRAAFPADVHNEASARLEKAGLPQIGNSRISLIEQARTDQFALAVEEPPDPLQGRRPVCRRVGIDADLSQHPRGFVGRNSKAVKGQFDRPTRQVGCDLLREALQVIDHGREHYRAARDVKISDLELIAGAV